MEDYSAKLTGEPFLYEESKIIARYLLEGEDPKELRKRNVEENLIKHKKVTIHREYNWHGNLLKYGILVDGKEIGGVKASESIELDLEFGKHTIVVNQFSSNGGIYHSCSKTIEIKENSENITINIGVGKFNVWKDLMGQSNLLEITSITGENITIS